MSISSGSRDSRQRWTKARLLDRLEALERRIAAPGDGGALPAEAIDAIPAGFVAFDSEDRLVVCNKAYRALFGYSDADAAPGVSFDALMRLDIERQTVAACDRAGDGYPRRRLADWRRAGAISEDIHFGDGRWIQVRDRKTASGGRVSIHADITVLKRAEGALRLSQEQLRNLVETAPDAIISVDEAGLVLTWNARAAEMFGYGAKAVIGKSLTKLMPKRYRGAHAKGLARVNSGAEPRFIGNTVELVGLRKSGEEFPIELSLSSALHEGTRLHTGIVRDVSELRRTNTALRESERRYGTITANVPGVVYERVLHPDGSVEIPYVSPGLLETHGLDPEAVMRDPTPWLAAVHPGDRERLAASNAQSVERLEDWSLEYRIIARDGTTKWVRGISHIRREDNGDVVWDGILLDISEERRNRQRIAEVAKFPSEDPNPVLRVAPDGAVLYANDAARTVDGLLVGRRKDRLSRKLAAAREQALAGGGRRIAEFAGGERIFSFTVAPVVGETYVNLYGRDITDDRLTQRRVADIAKFAAENPNPMFRVEPDGKVLYANDATRDVDGLLVGRRKDKLSRKLAKVLAAVSRDGRRRNVEFAGTERVFSLAVTPVAGETYINLYGRDITREYHARHEMAAAREAAVAAEALLRDAIDNISDGFAVYDADERLVTCNRKWKDFYGYSDAEAAPGVTYRDLVRLDIAKGAISKGVGYRDTYQDMRLAYRKVKEGAFEVKLADGRWLLIHERSTSAGGRVGIHTDITELKRAEEALRESAERYDIAVTGANDGLWDWNLVAGEIYVSPHAKKLLGLEFEGETTAPDEWNARVHPDDLEQFKDRERMYLSGEIEHYTNEYRVLGADGTYRWVLDRGACLRDEKGRPYRMAGSLGDITERKRGEQFLRTVVETIPAHINIRDAKGRYVLTNRRLADYYGIDPRDTIGKFPEEEFPSSSADEKEGREFRQVIETGAAIVDSEYKYDDGGTEEYWLTTRQPIHDAAGRLQFVLTVAYEITERKRAEEALRRNSELLHAVVNAVPAMISAKDRDSRYVFINRYQADLYGCSVDEAIGKTAGQLLGRGYGAQTRRLDRAVIAGGEALPYYEEDHVDAQGVHRNLIATKVPLNDDEGRVRGVVTVALDITERKQSEQFLRSVVDTLPAALSIRDKRGRYVLINKRLADYYGIDPEDTVGKLPSDVFAVHHSDEIPEHQFRRVQETGGAIVDSEMKYTQEDGTDEYWLTTRQPLHDAGGALQYVLSLSYDITDLKQAEEALRAEKQRTDEANALVKEQNQMLESLSGKLSRYLPPQLYASIFSGAQSVEIESKRKKLTVIFSDIAGFTATTDRLESEELTSLLNHYLTEMSRIGLEYGATIDKFVGDAIIMFFGDPDSRGVKRDAIACVEMAIAMQRRMAELQTEWRDRGIEHPFALRIGINTGYCTVGNFGSEDRMDYTIVGNAVNLASRLQTRAEVGGILMANETYSLVKHMVCAELEDTITLKGFHEPIRTYRVAGLYDDLADQGRVIRRDEDGLTLLVDRDKLTESGTARAIAALEETLARLKD